MTQAHTDNYRGKRKSWGRAMAATTARDRCTKREDGKKRERERETETEILHLLKDTLPVRPLVGKHPEPKQGLGCGHVGV